MNAFDCQDSLNEYDEILQWVGDICLNLDYWDCGCESDYIHPIKKLVCKKCDVSQEDSPSSREDEVNRYIHIYS